MLKLSYISKHTGKTMAFAYKRHRERTESTVAISFQAGIKSQIPYS